MKFPLSCTTVTNSQVEMNSGQNFSYQHQIVEEHIMWSLSLEGCEAAGWDT